MRIFVINLAKNVERMNLIDARLHGMALNYERIEAVYGKMVPQDERRRTSSRFWWWCIRGIPMRDGEYGCAMSHLEVYRRMIDENINVACVLEDDAKPRACLPNLLMQLERTVKQDCAQVALISNHRDSRSGTEFSIERVNTGAYTDGYVLTLPAAKMLLKKNLPVKCPSDSWTLWAGKRWIELFQVYPEGVNQEWDTTEGYASDVTTAGDVIVDTRKMSFVQLVLWKLKRVFGILLCNIFLR